MADSTRGNQTRPDDRSKAPDPARSYERAKPEAEAGMGRLDNDVATPTGQSDQQEQAVPNRQAPRQINADEVDNGRPGATQAQPDHSMKQEEPLGADQRPLEAQPDRDRRHPRTEGRGATP